MKWCSIEKEDTSKEYNYLDSEPLSTFPPRSLPPSPLCARVEVCRFLFWPAEKSDNTTFFSKQFIQEPFNIMHESLSRNQSLQEKTTTRPQSQSLIYPLNHAPSAQSM